MAIHENTQYFIKFTKELKKIDLEVSEEEIERRKLVLSREDYEVVPQ